MKKVLIASTALVLVAGAAVAEVKVGGSGRMGLAYDSTGGGNTTASYRLRLNFDASTESDAGVKFGGRIRLQDDGSTGNAYNSAAYVYAESGGFHMEVGNANTAYDSAALIYNSEIGFRSFSQGDPQGSFYSFSSGGYTATPNRVGVYASYAVGSFNGRVSYVDPDQTASGTNPETSVSADYKFGAFTVAAAYAHNGAGIAGKNVSYIAGEYAMGGDANVGAQWFDDGANNHWTLYGNKKFGAVTAKAFVADSDAAGANTAFGIGADYDLGGATLSGAVQQDFAGETQADLGVSFSF